MPLTPITYCRTDPVSGRWTGIDDLLSELQVDYNFYNHDTRIATLEANYTLTVSLAGISQPSPSTILFTLTDDTTQGPFDLPIASFTDQGDWAIDTPYLVNDTFIAPDGGLYRVTFAHTSSHTSFDPHANDGAGHDYYASMIPPRGNLLPTGGAAGMYFRKNSGTDYDANWATIRASEVTFSASSGSLLTSDNVADALEELESRIESGDLPDALFISYTPPTGSWLVSITVADAIDELSNINASHVGFTPSSASALVSTNVSDALEELETLVATGGGEFLPLAGGTMAGAIELAADPASAMQPTTKQYVDGLALNLGKRGRVRAATTANITISTALNNADSIDGVTLATGDLVLVKSQSSAAENGVYVVGASPARFSEYDTYDEHPGSLIAVEEGSTNADTMWLCTSNAGGTLNSTAITFNQQTATGALLASNNLSDLGNAGTARTNLGVGTGDSPQFTALNVGHASDTTITRTGAGDIAVEGNAIYRAGGTDVPVTDGGTGASTASGARTNLGLAIGTDVQAYDAQLSSLVRQNSQTSAYTTVLGDGGKHIYHPSADNNARTFTIDSNANVAYPVGTVITFVNEVNVVTIAITSDTLTLMGAGTTGSRTLAANGIATALKVASTKWVISGSGLT